MRIGWLNKSKGGRVIVFFTGWGMDVNSVSHLKGDYDILVIYDYNDISKSNLPDLNSYKEIYIIAWSMGVWAASNILPFWKIKPMKKIAFNGTEFPVDNSYGIPVSIYTLTEKGMSEKGREKFIKRMFTTPQEIERFYLNNNIRDIENQKLELISIHQQSQQLKNTIEWDKAFISSKDVIFPVQNQINAWERRTKIAFLETAHYPFFHFSEWDEIIKS